MKWIRVREEDDGSVTTFELAEFENDGPYHAEIRVTSKEELVQLHKSKQLIAVRMRGKPVGKTLQTNLIPPHEIDALK